MSSPSINVPRIHLLFREKSCRVAFEEAQKEHDLSSLVNIDIHDGVLKFLPSSVRYDTVVSPANSHGFLDGAFDDAISLAFSPTDDYMALTKVAQAKLYDEWKGFAPPGTCTLVKIPDEFVARSKNVWGVERVALCPTMRIPTEVQWDREVAYECVWSLLCSIDKHNRSVDAGSGDSKIQSILMTPLATGVGRVSPERWATQAAMAIRHFVEASKNPDQWSAPEWFDVIKKYNEVSTTWVEEQ